MRPCHAREQLCRLMLYLFFEYPNIHDHVTQNENKNIDNNFLEHQVHSTTPKHQMIVLLKKFQSFLYTNWRFAGDWLEIGSRIFGAHAPQKCSKMAGDLLEIYLHIDWSFAYNLLHMLKVTIFFLAGDLL